MSTYQPIPVTPVNQRPLWCLACKRWATQCGQPHVHPSMQCWVIESGQHSKPVTRLIFWLLAGPAIAIGAVVFLLIIVAVL